MQAKKKILYINDFKKGGGAETVFSDTAALMSKDYEVFTYSAFDRFEDSNKNIFSFLFSFKHYRAIKSLIEKEVIDIVHVHNFRWLSPSVFYVRKKLTKKIPFYLTAHDYLLACPNVAYGYFQQNIFHRIAVAEKITYWDKRMDEGGFVFSWLKKIQWLIGFKLLKLQSEIKQVLVPSQFLGNILQKHYPELSIQVVRNPVELPKTNRRASVALPIDTLKMVFIGRVQPEKGIDLLLSHLGKLKEKLSFTLDIYGTGTLADQMASLIQANGLSDCVSYKGFMEKNLLFEQYISAYDAFVMSSIWYENAPLSIVEAAAAGLKLIIPDMGGMKELAEICGNACFYNVDNAESLGQAMESVGLVEANQRIDVSEFSFENYRSKVENVYLEK